MTRSLLIILIFLANWAFSQSIVSDHVLSNDQLADLLKEDIRNQINSEGQITEAELAEYFRKKFSERFFYDYKSFNDRLSHYNGIYALQEVHKSRAMDHMAKYQDSTLWKLPFNYQYGEAVNAYALRHLARQHKMVDIALYYLNSDKAENYIDYFTRQQRSLNAALELDAYEKIEDGNGVYEAFRSGYRVLNWLWIHNMFLSDPGYSNQDQLTTIATLLQHGQHLYERNNQFRSGNHQTRGVSALAMLAILFGDFEGTDQWYERAMKRLGEHLDREINEDGFQFERSVHYHMSDINNYFYVYQLAKINKISVAPEWEGKLRGLFTTLAKLAYPDRSAPVLQDDTEIPWAEKNDISGAMTLGYLLFEDPEFGYFATQKVDDRVYWFLSNAQIRMLDKIQRERPEYGSLSFDETGYYIMREGWDENDKMMIITAGLDEDKPDHQHGDMLGIQAIAHGVAILPNYQVRYSLKDFDFFKNSMVKNVALVDDELQGKQWTSNRGGSGFGKFRELPEPELIKWQINDNFDYFAGKHDGFENIGVNYSRQVIYVKDDFWIVKDNFNSEGIHEYKQVWQGHYTTENGPGLLRATAAFASGHDILQLNEVDSVYSEGTRGKHWSVVSKKGQQDFSFVTVIYPYKGYSNRLDELAEELNIGSWKLNDSGWEEYAGDKVLRISKDHESYFFGLTEITLKEKMIEFSQESDVYIRISGGKAIIHSIGTETCQITVPNGKKKRISKELNPGESWELDLNIR